MAKAKLTRSRSNRMLGGVCAGLAAYLGVDPTFVRLLFVVLALADGVAVLIYLLLWILMPLEGQKAMGMEGNLQQGVSELAQRAGQLGQEAGQVLRQPHPQAGMWLGGALIAAGAVLFLRGLGISWLNWLNTDVLWPLLLVAGGLVLILRRREEGLDG